MSQISNADSSSRSDSESSAYNDTPWLLLKEQLALYLEDRLSSGAQYLEGTGTELTLTDIIVAVSLVAVRFEWDAAAHSNICGWFRGLVLTHDVNALLTFALKGTSSAIVSALRVLLLKVLRCFLKLWYILLFAAHPTNGMLNRASDLCTKCLQRKAIMTDKLAWIVEVPTGPGWQVGSR